jgi:nicotinate-nucleotide adenylyltransferase
MKAKDQSTASQVIALFGGSFDPPHLAHQTIPIFLLENKLVDQVWYVPVKHHPFGKTVSSDIDRVEMLKKTIDVIVAAHPEFASKMCIEMWELEQDGTSFTIETLTEMKKKHSEYTFRWVIGTDNLSKFNHWQAYQEILNQFGVLVYPRAGYPSESLLPGMVFLKDAPEVKVSSTEIRQRIAFGQSVEEFISPEVENYIEAHKLFKVHGIT